MCVSSKKKGGEMMVMRCNKNWVFRGGENFPPCLRDATVRVEVSKDGTSHTVYACDACANMLALRCPAWNPVATPLEKV